MGISKSKFIKLGIFVVAAAALFIFALFYIGSKENLFTKTITLYSVFPNVNGLTQGNAVQFAGISVGTVQGITIISSNKVCVNLKVVSDVQKFIKKNSIASINSDGLVGNKVLSLSSGSDSVSSVENGDTLPFVTPIVMGDIINNLNESTKEAEKISKDLADIVRKVNEGEGTLGKLVNNSDVFDNLDSLMSNFGSASENVDKILSNAANAIKLITDDLEGLQGSVKAITSNVEDITRKINSSESLVGTLLTDTVFANNIKNIIVKTDQTSANLELGSFSFYQNMEALKHNFLFKGYFEDLGYWDKTTFEKNMDTRETRILNKEHELDQKELKLKKFQVQLDSLRNILYKKLDSLQTK